MKNIILIYLFLGSFISPVVAQTSVFDEMMAKYNSDAKSVPEHVGNALNMMSSNNTIRNSPQQPNGFQYISYAHAQISRTLGSRKSSYLLFENVPESFIDNSGNVNRNRDRLEIKIYKKDGNVKVDTKLLSWGNVVITRNATIEATVLNGYIIKFQGTDGSTTAGSQTILLNPTIFVLK